MPTIEIEPNTIEAISQAVVRKINQDKTKQAKKQRDWRLRNTKLLLKHYHILKEHCAEIDDEIEAYADSIFDPEELELKTIMASKAKTRKMVWYIDEMLAAYERYCKRAGDAAQRRYAALTYYYINTTRPSFETLAFNLNVSERTIRRDLEDARKEFSVFLFGINALEDLEDETEAHVQKLAGQCP